MATEECEKGFLFSFCSLTVISEEDHEDFISEEDCEDYHKHRTELPSEPPPPTYSSQPEFGYGLHKIPFADWPELAQTTLNKRLARKLNTKKAKNVIYFIGDGMGISTLALARLHKSQFDEITMDKVHLAWDEWIDTGLVKVRKAVANNR